LLRRPILSKPSKRTTSIAAAGIGIVAAASVAAALTLPGAASAGAATAAAHVSPPSRSAGVADAWAVQRVQVVGLKTAVQARLTAMAKAERAAAARRAARKAAAARAAAHRAALLAAEQSAATPSSSPPAAPAPAPVQPSGSAQQIAIGMLGSFGWSSSQFACLDPLWSHESGWNVTAANPDGAYGIPQALPGSKMASAGPDWQTDAATQIRWGLGYIKALYGSPCGAWAHEEATGWY
jgi:hypothetical protein